MFEPAMRRRVVLYSCAACLLRVRLGDGARFPANGHLVGQPPAAIMREDHSAPCFVLETGHASDGVQISPQALRRSRRRCLAPPFQRDDDY
jgi:hypothetical protein